MVRAVVRARCLTVERLCLCGQVLLEVADRLECPACRRPALSWRVMLHGEVVASRNCRGEVEVAAPLRDALRAALAEGGEVLPPARLVSPRRRAGRWVA